MFKSKSASYPAAPASNSSPAAAAHPPAAQNADSAVRAALTIQRMLKIRIATRRMRKRISEAMYTKKIDPATGKFYHVLNKTGEVTWDVPRGDVPFAQPPETVMRALAAEQALIKKKKKQESEKRQFLIAQRIEEHKQSFMKEQNKAEEAEKLRRDNLWKDAVEHGAASGEVNLSWQNLGDISDRVYAFKKSTGIELTHLRLVGHDLEVIPRQLAYSCSHLVSLSLTSNRLTNVDAIASLTALTSLVLLRNRIAALPADFGNLMRLEVLELASNRLELLPATFGNLTKLGRLNLECNRLRRVPETLARMEIKVFNLNSNALLTLPTCLAAMPALEQISCNDNQLKYLPAGIGDSKTISAIHACNNRLMELPDRIGDLKSLKNLWLDYNNITALPMSFYKLTNLIELKMEGNYGMVYPTIDKIIRGPKGVLAWSRKRFATSVFGRQQSIVLTFQDVLKQVAKHQLGGDEHRGIFEKDVEYKAEEMEEKEGGEGEKFYQFVEPLFWDLFLPTLENMWGEGDSKHDMKGDIKSFPYSKEEAMRVMNSFKDPYGPIVFRSDKGWFRRCVCKKPDGSRQVCVPPKVGWMCERHVMLVKMTITLEKELVERQRQQQEKARIAEVEAVAEKSANEYLRSDAGKLMIFKMAQTRAHELQALESTSKFKGALEIEFRKKRAKLEKAFKKKEKKLQEQRNRHHDELVKLKDGLMTKGKELVGWAAEQNDIAIDKILDELANMPQDAALGKLQDEYEKDVDKLVVTIEENSKKGSLVERIVPTGLLEFARKMGKDHNEKLSELQVDLCRQYTEREVYRARKKEKLSHAKMRKIMASWTGLGLRDTFKDWKNWTKRRVKVRRRDIRAKNRDDRFQYEQDMANLDFAKWNLGKWNELWDDFNDLKYWVHSETGESTYDEPKVEMYFPKGWVEPAMPACMKNPENGEVLSPRTLRVNEADTPSEASEASSEDSDAEWKASKGHGGSGGGADGDDEDASKKDDAVEGMTPADGEEAIEADIPVITNNDDKAVGFADEDLVVVPDGTLVTRESASASANNELVVRKNEEALREFLDKKPIGRKEEIDIAQLRVLEKRRAALQRKAAHQLNEDGTVKEEESEIAKAMAKAAAEEAERVRQPTEEEVMIMVGFDPAKGGQYTTKELDAFAAAAIKKNKEIGRTANGGVGDLTGADGRTYGSYEPDIVTGFFSGIAKVRANNKQAAAMKKGPGGKGKKDEVDNSPTGLGTVFSRQGPRNAD